MQYNLSTRKGGNGNSSHEQSFVQELLLVLEHLGELPPLLLAVVGEGLGDWPHGGDLRGHVRHDLLGHLGVEGWHPPRVVLVVVVVVVVELGRHLLPRVDVQPRHVVPPKCVAGHVIIDRLGQGGAW